MNRPTDKTNKTVGQKTVKCIYNRIWKNVKQHERGNWLAKYKIVLLLLVNILAISVIKVFIDVLLLVLLERSSLLSDSALNTTMDVIRIIIQFMTLGVFTHTQLYRKKDMKKQESVATTMGRSVIITATIYSIIPLVETVLTWLIPGLMFSVSWYMLVIQAIKYITVFALYAGFELTQNPVYSDSKSKRTTKLICLIVGPFSFILIDLCRVQLIQPIIQHLCSDKELGQITFSILGTISLLFVFLELYTLSNKKSMFTSLKQYTTIYQAILNYVYILCIFVVCAMLLASIGMILKLLVDDIINYIYYIPNAIQAYINQYLYTSSDVGLVCAENMVPSQDSFLSQKIIGMS